MVCSKCGTTIPDSSSVCPKCSAEFGYDDENKTIVYVSQKEWQNASDNTSTKQSKGIPKVYYILLILIALMSFFFISMDYFRVSIANMAYNRYTGYQLIQYLGGTASLTGYCIIGLIILNCLTIIVCGFGLTGRHKHSLYLFLGIAYIIVTVVPYFNISSVLSEFDPSLTRVGISLGFYLNLGVGVVSLILYLILSRVTKE